MFRLYAMSEVLAHLLLIPILLGFTSTAHADSSAKLKSEILSTHNHLRAKHHAPALVWDDELADYAQHHAAQCEFRHSYGPYGENLAVGYRSAARSIDRWYGERADYSYASPGFGKSTGHFTQVVWKSSKKIGCAYVNCGGKNRLTDFLVCEYSPAGNVVNPGFFSANVLPEHHFV